MTATDKHRTGPGRFALLACAGLFLMACARPQPGASPPGDRHVIGAGDVKRHVEELASDPYEGRGAGYVGEDKAAAYIEAQFKAIGLRPAGDSSPAGRSFRQRFQFHPRGPELPGQVLTSRNVLGFLEGEDEALRRDIVVLGAHHDGQGLAGQADADRFPAPDGSEEDTVWNSADDNASSVAALIEVARAIRLGHDRHRRSLMFVTFGAEEHALNGSVHYVTNPPYPLERHVAMVNLEKLGRAEDQELAAASTGTCLCWDGILADANAATGWKVRSAIAEIIPDTDHYPFAADGIPAIVLGTIHEEDTHRPGDSADKIGYDLLAARAEYVRAVLLDLANRSDAPRFAGAAGNDVGMIPVVASDSEIRILGLPAGSGALKVSGVIPGLPAERAGLVPGDFIVRVNGRTLKKDVDKEAVQQAADRAPEGIEVAVQRQGQREMFSIRPGRSGRG
jgi:hypothetical protein